MAKNVTNEKTISKASDEALEIVKSQETIEDTSNVNLVDEGTKEEVKTFFEDENGNKFSFTKRTPEKFRFNGIIKSQAEWLQDEDAMEMLIYGNSMYINQLKN